MKHPGADSSPPSPWPVHPDPVAEALAQQVVPLVFNRRASVVEGRRLRNFDVLDVALNHLEASGTAQPARERAAS